MTFTAQQLQHKVALQRATIVRDEYGGFTQEWTTYAEPYARVDPLLGREYFQAAQIQAEQTVKFTLRWRDDVKAKDQLLYNGSTFNIQSAIDVGGRRREMLIYAKALD